MTLRCSACQAEKPEDQFYRSWTQSRGYSYLCIPCTKAKVNAHRAEKPEKERHRRGDYAARLRAENERRRLEHEERKRNARAKVTLDERRARRQAAKRKYRYGITQEQFDELWERQDGRCAICRTPLDVPHVDHNHQTDIVRGLTCQHCNNGLGHFKDDPALLLSAAEYLRRANEALGTTPIVGDSPDFVRAPAAGGVPSDCVR